MASDRKRKTLRHALMGALLLSGAIIAAFIAVMPGRRDPGRPERRPADGTRGGSPSIVEPERDPRQPRPRGTTSGKEQGEGPVRANGPVRVESEGVAPALPRGDAEVVFELEDSSGRPVEGASVRLRSGLAAEEVLSNAKGLAFFPRVAAGTFTFVVSGHGLPELVSATPVEVAAGERKVVSVPVGPYDLAIGGKVLDHGGLPVEGIHITAQRQLFEPGEGDLLPADPDASRATSARDGSYEIHGLEAADYVLSTAPSGGFPAVRRVYRAGASGADIILDALRLLRVYGSVTARDGGALEGARVHPLGQAAQAVETDASGSYDLELEVGEGSMIHIVVASLEGYREARASLRLEEVGKEDSWRVDLVLEPLGARASITGTVRDSEGTPVAGETVRLLSASLNARYEAVSATSGHFAIDDVQVGSDYRLWVHPRAWFKDYNRSPVEVTEDGAALEIVLEPLGSGRLQGVMVDPDGNPVPRFTLWLRSKKAVGNAVPVTGDEQGRFEAGSVPEGQLLFEVRSLPSLTVRGLEMGAGEAKDVRLVLDWGTHAFGGTVLTNDDSPVAGAGVSLYWALTQGPLTSTSFRSTVTNAEGKFSFSDLGAGDHRITVTSPEHMPGQAEYTAGTAAPEPVIRLKPREAARR